MKILEFDNISELSRHATQIIIETIESSIREKDFFSISLCGGSSPIEIFKNLVDLKDQIDWNKVFIFWGDERFVKLNDDNSNYKLVKSLLMSKIKIPEKNIFKTPVHLKSAEKASEVYEKNILDFFDRKNCLNSQGIPVFDIMLQGAGNDGHTASLFPGIPQLNEGQRLVVSVKAPDYAPIKDRISFTFKLINSADKIMLLLSGSKKAQIAEDFIENNPESNLPIQLIDRGSRTTALVDKSIFVSS